MTLLTGFVALCIAAVPDMSPGDIPAFSMDTGAILTSLDYFNPDEYMVNPGDNIWVSFPGGIPFSGQSNALSTTFIPVGLDGILNIPTIPNIDTNGMTLQELQNTIAGLVSSAYRGMKVSVGLSRSASFQIPVTGQVVFPGIVTVNGLSRLTETVEQAGGLSSSGASSSIILISFDGDSTIVNLNEFFTNGDLSSNPLVQRNSRVHVPTLFSTITVEGAISLPNSRLNSGFLLNNRKLVEFIPGEDARAAIVRVGGTSNSADLDACFVHRTTSDSTPEFLPFSMQGLAPSLTLQPGDRIVVPSMSEFINVTGQVVFTGPVPYSPGMSVNYYIGLAGGYTSVARRNSVNMLLFDGEMADVELTDIVPPGATIDVPRVPVKFWEEYLVILTGVATVVIAYQSIFN